MITQWNFEQRMMAVNCALFVGIVALTAFLLTDRAEIPGAPPTADMKAFFENYRPAQVANTDNQVANNLYQRYGEAPIFTTIIERPTPPPTPEPTKPVPPPLQKAIASWKLNGLFAGMAMLIDRNTRVEWNMSPTDPETRSKKIKFQGQEMEIVLESVDESAFEATFSAPGKDGPQFLKKSVFDEDK